MLFLKLYAPPALSDILTHSIKKKKKSLHALAANLFLIKGVPKCSYPYNRYAKRWICLLFIASDNNYRLVSEMKISFQVYKRGVYRHLPSRRLQWDTSWASRLSSVLLIKL